MKFKAGDVVEVQGVVKYDQRAEDDLVFIDVNYSTVNMEPSRVTLVQQGFKVGDSATISGGDAMRAVTILAINENRAWINGENFFDNIVDLYELRRPEPVEEPEQPPIPPIGDAGVILPATDEALEP